jgi:hypothetical protein
VAGRGVGGSEASAKPHAERTHSDSGTDHDLA